MTVRVQPGQSVRAIKKRVLRLEADARSALGSEGIATSEAGFSRALLFAAVLAAYCERLGYLDGSELGGGRDWDDFLSSLISLRDRFSNDLFLPSGLEKSGFSSAVLALLAAGAKEIVRDLTLAQLGLVFELYYCSSSVAKHGVYYTPQRVARSMVVDALGALTPGIRGRRPWLPRVVDPACGSGMFLLEALRQLEQLNAGEVPLRELISRCIYGVDQDRHAVEMARLMLQLYALERKQLNLFADEELHSLRFNFGVGNSLICSSQLLHSNEHEEIAPFDWEENFPEAFAEGGFDCVIGNPPYGLSREEKISAAENACLKRVYSQERTGKVNKYMAFMALGYKILRPGGQLALVVPNSWLGIEGGRAIRTMLLRERALHKVVLYRWPIFEEPSVEAVTFRACKLRPRETIALYEWHNESAAAAELMAELPVAECLKAADCRIPLRWTPASSTKYHLLLENSVPLGSPASGFCPMIALQAYATGKGTPPQTALDGQRRVFHSELPVDESHLPYLNGQDVSRYAVRWSGSYLKHGPWLADPQSIERFTGPRIVLREVLGAGANLLVAAFVKETYLYNKSVLHILPRPGTDEEMVWALLAILNSSLGSFVIGYSGRKSQRRLFPKIVNSDIRDFPLTKQFARYVPQLAAGARLISSAVARNQPTAEITDLQYSLDRLVESAYEVGESSALGEGTAHAL